MVNVYLVLAYAFAWGIFMVYAWILQGRQKRLEMEIAELRKESEGKGLSPPA